MHDRYIPYNDSVETPNNLMFFDTETKPDKSRSSEGNEFHRLHLGVAMSCRNNNGELTHERTLRFKHNEEFYQFLESRYLDKKPLWVFAHNLPFDLTIVDFWTQLSKGRFTLYKEEVAKSSISNNNKVSKCWKGLFVDDDPPCIFSMKSDSGFRVNFIDTRNFWRTSLARIGDMVGIKKLDIPKGNENEDSWFSYCENDVFILKKAVTQLMRWLKLNDLGKFRSTSPSQAMGSYRHRFMRFKIYPTTEQQHVCIERDSYLGGRLELFKRGRIDEKTYELDVRSLYPYVMRDNYFPVKSMTTNIGDQSLNISPKQITGDMIAKVTLKTNQGDYPYKCKIGTIYPVGEFQTTLCGPELMDAKEKGFVKQVHEYIIYKTKPIFKEFVDFFWEERLKNIQEGNEASADFCKLLMNSLYGKFGQLSKEWEFTEFDETDCGYSTESYYNTETKQISTIKNIAGNKYTKVERGPTNHTFPAISSFVTSYARKYMLDLLTIAGKENTFYLVTDALYTNERGYLRLCESGVVNKNTLGMLELKSEAEFSHFDCLHHYTVGNKSKHGSRKKSAKPNPNGGVDELQFQGLSSVLKNGGEAGIMIKKITKHYKMEYKRGVTSPNGKVTPLLLPDDLPLIS